MRKLNMNIERFSDGDFTQKVQKDINILATRAIHES